MKFNIFFLIYFYGVVHVVDDFMIEMHDSKNHVKFMRMNENKLCVIYLMFKTDFFNLNLIIY